jgi:hypothetical protein
MMKDETAETLNACIQTLVFISISVLIFITNT